MLCNHKKDRKKTDGITASETLSILNPTKFPTLLVQIYPFVFILDPVEKIEFLMFFSSKFDAHQRFIKIYKIVF